MPLAVPWRKALLFTAALALLLIPSLGFVHLGMGSMGGQTGNCPFMPGHAASLCHANPVEHLQEWQSLFTVLPQDRDLLSLLLLLMGGIAIFYVNSIRAPLVGVPLSLSQRVNFFRPNSLQEAFSRGILNSKVF